MTAGRHKDPTTVALLLGGKGRASMAQVVENGDPFRVGVPVGHLLGASDEVVDPSQEVAGIFGRPLSRTADIYIDGAGSLIVPRK
jgi:hypothetical protein